MTEQTTTQRPRRGRPRRKKTADEPRPLVLVLEGLAGASDCARAAGAQTLESSPTNLERVDDLIDNGPWDALLLTGGGDVDPRLYDQRPHGDVYGVSETRDLVETYALEAARARRAPVLGICRGAQIINVEAGGSLRQHVRGHRGTQHRVDTEAGSVARAAAGARPRVVSLHHQRVERVAPGYSVTGRAPDGTAEAVESEDGRVLGVQFHPEMDAVEAYARSIFRWLVEAAAERAGLPAPSERPLPARRERQAYSPSRYHTVRRKRRRGKRDREPLSYPVDPLEPRIRMSGVRHYWVCPRCGMTFDDMRDRDDHVVILHDPDVDNAVRALLGPGEED